MKSLLKTLTIGAVALTLTAAAIDTADAGRRGRHNAARFGAGIVTGLVAGALLYGATRPGYAEPVYETYSEPECYRGPRQCRSNWNCWLNRWGREVCEKHVSCTRPLICE